MKAVATTGQLWEPPFWRRPEYLATSPWEAARIEAAFGALKQLYPENVCKAAFAGWLLTKPEERNKREALLQKPLWQVLIDPFRADLSKLLRFGFDAVDGQLFRYPGLVRKLREDIQREFKGARFELRCLAALRNAGMQVDYEPLAGKSPGPNPDFRLHLPNILYVDAKHVDEGHSIQEEERWLLQLMSLDNMNVPLVSADVRLTAKCDQMLRSTDGRAQIRANIPRLSEELNRVKLRLATSEGPFPARELIEELIEVEVREPPSSGSSSSLNGLPADLDKEVARIVGGQITKGASQIPPGEVGLVLLNPGRYAPTPLLTEELKRWMVDPGGGALYPNLVGVLVVSEVTIKVGDQVAGTLETIVPVWRDSAPDWVVEGPWEQLSNAFAQHDREAIAYRPSLSPLGTTAA